MAWFIVGPIREVLPLPPTSVGPAPGKIVRTLAIIEATNDQAAINAPSQRGRAWSPRRIIW